MKKIFKIFLIITVLFSVNVKALELDINSNNAILINLNEDTVLYEKNSEEKTSIASLTKIMTALVVLDKVDDLDKLKIVIDWSKVDKTDYLLAMERSPIKDVEIKELLKQSLTDKINDREVFMKGIDNSYLYEGYVSFKVDEL